MPESTAQPVSVPTARSPLAIAGNRVVIGGWEYSDRTVEGPVVVADRSSLSKIHVRATATADVIAALGTRFGRAVWLGNRLVIGSGPDEWLVLGAPGQAAEISADLESKLGAADSGHVSVMDVTHGRALIRVSGPEALSLLSRVTAVDLDDRLVPTLSALRTSLVRVVTDIIRDDQGSSASYLLHCERSSGRYLQASLLAAGADLGVVADSSQPSWPDHA